MEALVCWENARRGLMMSSEFIQVAEETGLIVPIGKQVLEGACRQPRKWHEQQITPRKMTMCVNLSMRQLQDSDPVDKVERALERVW
jgi:EAL domain-containing protein (putative c-di-GMP-specific phosphodiesterase class I)